MKFKIESGVEIPKCVGPGRARIYPFPDMSVGDSFEAKGFELANSVRSCSATYGKKTGTCFRTRKTSPGIWRCWRVS